MSRLLVHVEGQTEETFVNEVLGPYLFGRGFHAVSARLLGNARQRDRRGGIRAWQSAKRDILRHLMEDPQAISTTMVDYYGLPAEVDRAWPGRVEARDLPSQEKAPHVENAINLDLAQTLGDTPWRFVPFVVMHEYEGLLFSDCEAFGRGIGRPSLAADFQHIRDQFQTPEDINDSPLTAPSKRVEALVPGYEKPLLGTLAALEIGIDAIRRECPHFHHWLNTLIAMATEAF